MTSANTFANARIESGGSVRGPDEMGHDLFKIKLDRSKTFRNECIMKENNKKSSVIAFGEDSS